MNEIDEKALEYQKIPTEYINNLIEYYKKKFGDDKGLALTMSCFNYGVMIGKRQEREKHKKCVAR
ncbi:conserved hypothetical protein [Clostridiaceae bacterium BL-3]|nr:conserved hypothetical protein [Clostridiaceae bacterium BL-3]